MDEADKEFQRRLTKHQIVVTGFIAITTIFYVLAGMYTSAGISVDSQFLVYVGFGFLAVGIAMTFYVLIVGVLGVKKIK